MSEQDSDAIRRRVEKYYEDRSSFVIHLVSFVVMNAIFWGIWLFTHNVAYLLSWPWPSIISLSWGAGLAAHWLEVRSKSPGRLARVDRRVDDQMTDLYGPDWRDLADEAIYRKIQKAAHQQQRQNVEFAIHLVVFAPINLMLWLLWQGMTGGAWFPLPLVVMLLWGAGLAIHGATTLFNASRTVVAREKAVQRALGADIPKKKKRLEQARTLLTDDGELLEVVEDRQEEEHGLLHDAQ